MQNINANIISSLPKRAVSVFPPAFIRSMSGIFFKGPDKIGIILKARVKACVGHGLPLGEQRLRKIYLFFQNIGFQRDSGILLEDFANVILIVAEFVSDVGEGETLGNMIVYILYCLGYNRRHNISGYVF